MPVSYRKKELVIFLSFYHRLLQNHTILKTDIFINLDCSANCANERCQLSFLHSSVLIDYKSAASCGCI